MTAPKTSTRRAAATSIVCLAGLLALWSVAAAGSARASRAATATSAAASCTGTHWVGAWEAAPSDASQGKMVEDSLAPSELVGAGDKKLPVDDETIRTALTPSFGGSTLRIHLSNRFGTGPVTFTHVTVGHQLSGAELSGPPVSLTFGGQPSVTVPAGQDIVSDPAQLSYSALQTLEVSVFVAGDAGLPTEHYSARQSTYYALDGTGDHSGDTSAAAFPLQNSDRPYVDGVDVLAADDVGAVVALGDSITDGYQAATSAGIPASPQGFNLNQRWPDDLARRLGAAHIPLSVMNAGISGNRVLQAGTFGGGPDVFGPSALTRLTPDVLSRAGVTTVIWLEGINDIGQTPTATAAQIEAGYVQGIAAMHAAGLTVLQGTLTPAGSDRGSTYAAPAAAAEREQINQWILTHSPADGVIDFSTAIQDPADPAQMNPAYAGADGLHPNPAGYQAMANAIDLSALRLLPCAQPLLRISLTPARPAAGRRTTLRIAVTSAGRPVSGATVRLRGRHAVTGSHGHAAVVVTFARAGRVTIDAEASGYRAGSRTIRIASPRRRARSHGPR